MPFLWSSQKITLKNDKKTIGSHSPNKRTRERKRQGGREGNNLAFEGSRKKSRMYFWCTIFEMRSVNIHKKGKYKT